MCLTNSVSLGGSIGDIAWSRVSSKVRAPASGISIFAGLFVPLLAFPAIRRQADHLAVGQMEIVVAVQQGLGIVRARRHVRQVGHWKTDRGLIDGAVRARRPLLDVLAEDELRVRRIADQETGLLLVVGCQQQQQSPVLRLLGQRRVVADCERQAARDFVDRGLRLAGRHKQTDQYRTDDAAEFNFPVHVPLPPSPPGIHCRPTAPEPGY